MLRFWKNKIDLQKELGLTCEMIIERAETMKGDMNFDRCWIVAKEESRFVVLLGYEVEYKYKGHPPTIAFEISRKDGDMNEIENNNEYFLGIK